MSGRLMLIGAMSIIGQCFLILAQLMLTSANMEQQILNHFRPTMDKIKLSKVANILLDMQLILAEQRSRKLFNQSNPETVIERIAPPYRHNNSWPSPSERYLFEGDILLTVPQATRIFDWTAETKPTMHKRAALISFNEMLWDKMPIHYIFHSSLQDDQIPHIREALHYWQSRTCVTFSEVTEGSVQEQGRADFDGDVVVFYRGDGCYSMVGRAGGTQGISVGQQCTKAGLIAHEIGHALGLWHEQSRTDSACCIRILDENIQKGFHVNFRQRPSREMQTFGLPYDLGSVMHYRSNAFSIDDHVHTIETIESGYQRTIGQRAAPSFIDVHAVNKAYCSNKCPQELQCFYGGYTHPAQCNQCLCPDGLGGAFCEKEGPPINAICGGTIFVGNAWFEFTSPNYPQPYGPNQKCSWLIRAPQGFRVKLEFEHFDVHCNAVTCFDYVELKLDNRDFAKTGMRHCCTDVPTTPILSINEEMILIFNSEAHSHPGFKARVIQDPENVDAVASGQ